VVTGKISALAATSRTGTIRRQDGVLFPFSADVVLGDYNALAVGDQVSFDDGRLHRAVERVFREPAQPEGGVRKPDAPPDLRYAGFEQAGGARRYRFDLQVEGRWVQHAVTVDPALLLKNHVAVQEVPALCLHKLASDLKDSPGIARHQLSDEDLAAFISSRAAALPRKKPKGPFNGRRGSPPPAPSNQTRFS
jgi:hypothetical protein